MILEQQQEQGLKAFRSEQLDNEMLQDADFRRWYFYWQLEHGLYDDARSMEF
jgi:hypothetical protein